MRRDVFPCETGEKIRQLGYGGVHSHHSRDLERVSLLAIIFSSEVGGN